MSAVRELTPTMLARFTQIDYDREMALIATVGGGASERRGRRCSLHRDCPTAPRASTRSWSPTTGRGGDWAAS